MDSEVQNEDQNADQSLPVYQRHDDLGSLNNIMNTVQTSTNSEDPSSDQNIVAVENADEPTTESHNLVQDLLTEENVEKPLLTLFNVETLSDLTLQRASENEEVFDATKRDDANKSMIIFSPR